MWTCKVIYDVLYIILLLNFWSSAPLKRFKDNNSYDLVDNTTVGIFDGFFPHHVLIDLYCIIILIHYARESHTLLTIKRTHTHEIISESES